MTEMDGEYVIFGGTKTQTKMVEVKTTYIDCTCIE